MRPTDCRACEKLFIGTDLEEQAKLWVREYGGRKAQQRVDIKLRPAHRAGRHEERGLA